MSEIVVEASKGEKTLGSALRGCGYSLEALSGDQLFELAVLVKAAGGLVLHPVAIVDVLTAVLLLGRNMR